MQKQPIEVTIICHIISLMLRPLGVSVPRFFIQSCPLLFGSHPSALSIKVIKTPLKNPLCPSFLKCLNKYICLGSKTFIALQLFSLQLFKRNLNLSTS